MVVERFERAGGGVEQAAWRLVSELGTRGIETTVVCRQASGSTPENASVVRLPVPRTWQPLRVAAFSRGAARATRGFDVVHAFARTRHQHVYRAGGGSHAAYMKRVYRRPALRRLSPRHRAILGIERAVFRDPEQQIQCNARHAADEIARRYGVACERLSVIYNGVDTERFHPKAREERRREMRASLGLDGAAVLFVGSGFERKGLDRAIRALALASGPVAGSAVLLVAGRGSEAAHRRLARARGVEDRVRFLGPRPDVENLHAAADLFVLPTRYDAFSNACLEAMASGLPVATTAENGAAELIRDGENGLVSDDDFRPVLERLDDPEGLAALGAAARATAEEHTWSRHADETLTLYARVTGVSGRGS